MNFNDGGQHSYPVDEFGDRGYVFGSDNKPDINDESRDARHKMSIEIKEDFIRNDIFDKYVGVPKIDLDYEKENYLFRFPLYDVFNFLFALGQRFHSMEGKTIVKWPDQIEKRFEEFGIVHETDFECPPEIFDIEKHDRKIFEKWGKPKVSMYNGRRFRTGFFINKEKIYYTVNLEIFRPDENDRIGEFPPKINWI